MKGVSRDSIAMRGSGVIAVAQPVTGHRFTLDSILLADFCRVRPRERVLEPGAGTGIISLLLARKHPRAQFYPVEVQEDLCTLCRENCTANDLENVTPLHRDIRKLRQSVVPEPVDVVVANPPYVRTGAGRTSPDRARRIARQDVPAGLASWLDLQTFLKHSGRYTLVFPSARLAELLSLLQERGLEPKRIRPVHPYEDRPASLVLVEAVKGGGPGLQMLPPLVVHEPGGAYSQEMNVIYGLV